MTERLTGAPEFLPPSEVAGVSNLEGLMVLGMAWRHLETHKGDHGDFTARNILARCYAFLLQESHIQCFGHGWYENVGVK